MKDINLMVLKPQNTISATFGGFVKPKNNMSDYTNLGTLTAYFGSMQMYR
jgi:hypothetical protein